MRITFGQQKNKDFKFIDATPEHKWPVYRKGKITKVRTDELTNGDLIPLNRNELLGINGDMSLTYDDGFFAGYVTGDGW